MLDGASTDKIEPDLILLLNKEAILCADECLHTNKLPNRNAKIVHRPVNIAASRCVMNNIYHIQNVNAYDSRLKQWTAKFPGVF